MSVAFLRESFRLWENVEEYCRAGQATDDNMAHAHYMLGNQGYTHTHTHTQSQYVILIPFPLQQWLQERASMLRHTHTACLVYI